MIPPHLKGNKVPFSRLAVENSLKLFEDKAQMQRDLLHGHIEEAVAWRRLVNEFFKSQGYNGPALGEWNQAHQEKAKANEDMLRLAWDELNSQVEIHKAALEEGASGLVLPAKDISI